MKGRNNMRGLSFITIGTIAMLGILNFGTTYMNQVNGFILSVIGAN